MDINLNDIISDQETKNEETPKWKKYSIIGGVIAIFIVILIIIIILIATSVGGKKQEPLKEIIGEIICKYEISDKNNPTPILGKDFNYEGNFDILIDNQKVDFIKEYKFEETEANI